MIIDDGRQTTDDEKIEAFKRDLEDILDELSNIYVTEEEFNSSCIIYTDWFKNQYMLETSQNMTLIMSDLGFEDRKPGGRRVKYHGFDDAQKYYNERMKVLRELSEENRTKAMTIDADWYEDEMQKEKLPDDETLFTFGIDEIDTTLGELRRGNMLGILGPPKGGKTRLSNFIVQRALSLGLNVCVWPLEGSKEEWTAMQIAAYIRRTSGISYNSKDILQRKYRDDPKKSKRVAAAKLALATSPEMGRLSFIEGTAYAEDFLDVLQEHYDNENPFDVIVIDSLVNILSRTGKGKVDRISESYMAMQSFIKHGLRRPALAVIPAQLKQSVVDYIRKNR